jgi:Ferritin-like
MGIKEIETLDELRRLLQGAVTLEHATIPPYLYALYSIIPGTIKMPSAF